MLTALVLALLAATAPVESQPPPEAKTYTIAGTIRSQDGGQPVPDALVIVMCSCTDVPTHETQTNEVGQYRVTGLPAGEYMVQVLAGNADLARFVRLGPGPE